MVTKSNPISRTTIEKNDTMLRKHRQLLQNIYIKSSDSLDRYLLTFATGSLYLSIYFTSSLNGQLGNKHILSYAWISLVLSIIMGLIAISFSIKANERAVDVLDLQIEANQSNKELVGAENCWAMLTTILNIFTMATFIAGIMLLARFYFLNL